VKITPPLLYILSLRFATSEALKLAKEKGVAAVWDAKKRIDEQLGAA